MYQEALSIVFTNKRILFLREKIPDITFQRRTLDKKYIADFAVLMILLWN